MRSVTVRFITIAMLTLLALQASMSSVPTTQGEDTDKSKAGAAIRVIGGVNRFGVIPFKEGMTVRDAIIQAGDLTKDACKNNIRLMRLGQADFVRVDYDLAMKNDPSANVALKPGDTIYVGANVVSFAVLGSVKKPAVYTFKGRTTITDALSVAGGPAVKDHVSQVDLSNVIVVHKGLDDSIKAKKRESIDLSAILQGRAPDVDIQPGDVIYVPQKVRKPGSIQIASVDCVVSTSR